MYAIRSYYVEVEGKICVAEYASSMNGNGGDVIGNFGDALRNNFV